MRRVAIPVALTCVLASFSPLLSARQNVARTTVSLNDWGFASSSEIRWGEIAVARRPDGNRLVVQNLRRAKPAPPASAQKISERPAAPRDQAPRKATWIWNTSAILSDDSLRRTAIAFLQSEGIGQVFLQVPPLLRDPSGRAHLPASELAPFLSGLHATGISVEALHGGPELALPSARPAIVEFVRSVAAYNAAVPPPARFAGIHLDIEPYLLPGFGGELKSVFEADYISALTIARAACAKESLRLTVDVPFWFDVSPPGEPSLLSRVLPLVDGLCVMAYRTTADGPNGVLDLASVELSAASANGKDFWMGLETAPVADELLCTISGSPSRGITESPSSRWRLIMRDRDDSCDVFLLPPDRRTEEVGLSPDDESRVLVWERDYVSIVPGNRISFAGKRVGDLDAIVRRLMDEHRGNPAFAGVAIHHWESLKQLRDRKDPPR